MTHDAVPIGSSCRDDWRKSSFSNASGSCVEVQFRGAVVALKDSKEPQDERRTLRVGADEWRSFLVHLPRRPHC